MDRTSCHLWCLEKQQKSARSVPAPLNHSLTWVPASVSHRSPHYAVYSQVYHSLSLPAFRSFQLGGAGGTPREHPSNCEEHAECPVNTAFPPYAGAMGDLFFSVLSKPSLSPQSHCSKVERYSLQVRATVSPFSKAVTKGWLPCSVSSSPKIGLVWGRGLGAVIQKWSGFPSHTS